MSAGGIDAGPEEIAGDDLGVLRDTSAKQFRPT